MREHDLLELVRAAQALGAELEITVRVPPAPTPRSVTDPASAPWPGLTDEDRAEPGLTPPPEDTEAADAAAKAEDERTYWSA